MINRAALMLGLSTIAFGVVAAGTIHGGTAFAGARSETRDEKAALEDARKAQGLIAAGKPDAAVAIAEQAVGLRPQISDYRIVLGQAYMKSGRFVSARDAFGDVLSLEPGNGKAALNLSLAQIATGDWDGARKTLDAHSDTISASDRGLAMALAGDPSGAVEVLTAAVRTPGSDAKARQNLGLALALAGRWQEARSMVALDVAPAEVEQRMAQWATFAKPHAAYDQVSWLLGVQPVEDHGQPVALALNAATPVAVAQAAPAEAPSPVAQPPIVATLAPGAAPSPIVATPTPVAVAAVQFGPRHEVVQDLPAAASRPMPAPRAMAAAKPAPAPAVAPVSKPAAKGNFYVQLGAYQNAGVARDAWNRAARHFAGQSPSGMSYAAKGANFYRLSVGGFARADADSMCKSYRAKGGRCFVRTGAGDQMAAWVKKGGTQLASR